MTSQAPVADAAGAGKVARYAGALLLVALHGAALAILVATETPIVPQIAFLLGWGFFNFCWIFVFRRPAVAAGIALAFLVLLLALSRFKHEVLLMTVNFLDLMIIDKDTFLFLVQVIPKLDLQAAGAVAAVIFGLWVVWRLDRLRLRRRVALFGAGACLTGLVGVALTNPSDPWEEFYAQDYFSKYVRSAVTAISEFMTRGVLESDQETSARLAPSSAVCAPEKPPHVIVVHDESSFDIRAIPGVRVPEGYGAHFRSFDGKQRTLLVEGAGGPSWYTEYNVLTGLSARSFGRFVDFVTRIAAGRVERGLPLALRRCGYSTYTLYPMYGSFLGAQAFQETAGIEHFLDSKVLGAKFLDSDDFYFNAAIEEIRKNKGGKPLYLHVYTAQNHFPWTFRYRPDLARDWKDPGNKPDVDEYLRRQHLTATAFQEFRENLKRAFPDESFLIVRFGDHQPYFARHMIDPRQDDSMLVRGVAAGDPRFLATYYAIDVQNFSPRSLSSALDRLDAPYLPLMTLEAAGIPLDPSFAEQKKILERCKGVFFRCNNGAEAKRFNRMLIDAGMIKGL